MASATHTLHNLTEFPARILVILIRIYQQTVSRILPPTCRFAPSCSEYAAQAVTRYGVWRGSWRALRRVLKCHPFHPGGYDPVD